MKKIIIFLFCISIVFLTFSNKEENAIPKDSIRFRIIANSNSDEDQNLKMNIVNDLMPVFNDMSKDNNTIDTYRKNIVQNIPQIKTIINKYNVDYDINYGDNYFPLKTYKNFTYNEGYYESLVISLGQAKGDNFWCVLFPPLCLMESQADNVDDATYELYIKKILEKY